MYVLAGCTLPTPHTFLNCPLHMILHRGNVRQYNFSKEAVSGAPVTLYWTALAISKTLWNHRLDKTSLIDMEKPGCQVPSICLCNLFTCFEVISENILLVILGKSAYAEGAMFTHCSNRFWTPYYYNRLLWCRSYSAIFKDWFHNSCCALCCLLWFIPWHALLGTHHSYSTLAIVYVSALG